MSLGSWIQRSNSDPFIFYGFFKNGPSPASFSFIFGLLKQTLRFLQQINVKKCPSSIQCWDLNQQPLKHESPPITTWPVFYTWINIIIRQLSLLLSPNVPYLCVHQCCGCCWCHKVVCKWVSMSIRVQTIGRFFVLILQPFEAIFYLPGKLGRNWYKKCPSRQNGFGICAIS